MGKIKLSVVMATLNEENNIVDCLESCAPIADEIIVVDGESNDRTPELAEKAGATVFSVPNNKMFHINKNIAIKKATSKWILLIDADERVSTDLGKEIKSTIASNPSNDGYWINRSNWFLGGFLKKGGAYPDPVIRLFKKNKGRLAEISVHEQVTIDGTVGHLKNDIIHIADPSFARYLERADRYTDLTAQDLKQKKVKRNIINTVKYCLIKPTFTFCDIYIRHGGFKDGFRGFAWALFSSAHHYLAYSKYYTRT